MSDARKCRPFHRWQPVGNSDRFAPRATGRDGRAREARPAAAPAAAGVQPRRREGGGANRRDLQLLAEGWDKCAKSLRYEDGSPVEIVSDTNPYRKELEGLDTKEAEQ